MNLFELEGLTSIISRIIPIVSPACMELPYLGPLELLLCLSSPLYIAQPLAVSEKAYIKDIR